MIVGHFTCTYVVYRILNNRGVRLILPVLLVGAILPDIIDKPLAILLGFGPHGIAHSFVIVLPITGFSFLIFRNNLLILTSLQLGVLIHLIEDIYAYDQLLWPFMYNHYVGPQKEPSFVIGWYSFLYEYYILRSAPLTLFFEIICTLMCICFIAYDKIWTSGYLNNATKATQKMAAKEHRNAERTI